MSLLEKQRKIVPIQQEGVPTMLVLNQKVIMLDDTKSPKVICITPQGKIIYNKDVDFHQKKYALEYDYYHGILDDSYSEKYYFDRTENILYKFGADGVEKKYDFNMIKVGINQIPPFLKKSVEVKENENELLSLSNWIIRDSDKDFKEKVFENSGEMIKEFVKINL